MLKILAILLIDSAAAKELIVMEMPLSPAWRHQLGLQNWGKENGEVQSTGGGGGGGGKWGTKCPPHGGA